MCFTPLTSAVTVINSQIKKNALLWLILNSINVIMINICETKHPKSNQSEINPSVPLTKCVLLTARNSSRRRPKLPAILNICYYAQQIKDMVRVWIRL